MQMDSSAGYAQHCSNIGSDNRPRPCHINDIEVSLIEGMENSPTGLMKVTFECPVDNILMSQISVLLFYKACIQLSISSYSACSVGDNCFGPCLDCCC
jgi:hypothetical protein